MGELEVRLLVLRVQHPSLGNGKALELLSCDEASCGEVGQALLVSGQVVQCHDRVGGTRMLDNSGHGFRHLEPTHG